VTKIFARFSDFVNRRRKLVWLTVLALVVAVLVIVLTPVFLIMPFKPQTPRTLAVSYLMRRWSPLFTLGAAALILILTIGLWAGSRWFSRIALAILLIPTLAATWLARQNHFEWMFNPLPSPAYARSADASFVNDEDRVLAVKIGNESVAYPVRIMAYHHLVGDTVGGTPIVATY
jgi:Protein of unknown function (DUF3179)